jgi:hypothetical protein
VSLNRAKAVVAIVLVACGLAGYFITAGRHAKPAVDTPRPATHTLDAYTFATSVPPGWTINAKAVKNGTVDYHLSSTGKPIDGLGIGPAGTIGITISESGTKALAGGKLGGRPAAGYAPTELLTFLVGEPRQALSVVRAQSPAPRTLAGQSAGEEGYA